MTRRRLRQIPQRRPVFIGCEGESEVGYAGLLQRLLVDAGLPVYLMIYDLGCGAGDPLSRIVLAVQRLEHLRRHRIPPRQRFVLLDADQAESNRTRALRAQNLAAEHQIAIVWQRPCFEALLLRHLPRRAMSRPIDTAASIRELEHEWPDYRKPMTSVALGRRIDRDALGRAASVEPELLALLRCLDLDC